MLIAAALLTDTEYGLYDPKHIHRRSIKGAGNLKDWDAACRFIEFHANQEANKTGGVPDAEPPTNPVPSAS